MSKNPLIPSRALIVDPTYEAPRNGTSYSWEPTHQEPKEPQGPKLEIYGSHLTIAEHIGNLQDRIAKIQAWLEEWEEKIQQGIYPNADQPWKPLLGTRTRMEHWEQFVTEQHTQVACMIGWIEEFEAELMEAAQ